MDPSDKDALQAKLFLLLQTEQYEIALALLETLNVEGARNFEKAYALYRLHRENEAVDVLDRLKKSNMSEASGRGVQHLEAQLVRTRSLQNFILFSEADFGPQEYRQSSYQDAFDHYTQLLDTAVVSIALRQISTLKALFTLGFLAGFR